VLYIIRPSEKRAFLKLKTDGERNQFIEAFWRRRDPDPNTEENEYRREYEERVAYANREFGFRDVAGWRTDRGRIYILYGKPDEWEKVETGEIWFYRLIPEVGKGVELEFINVSGTGEFKLRGQP
jgi:GWxTD domain-containing protein